MYTAFDERRVWDVHVYNFLKNSGHSLELLLQYWTTKENTSDFNMFTECSYSYVKCVKSINQSSEGIKQSLKHFAKKLSCQSSKSLLYL